MTITINAALGTGGLRTNSLHRSIASNPALKAAFDEEAPHYEVLTRRLDTLVRSARQIQPVRTHDELARDVEEGLAAGEGVPGDLLATLIQLGDVETAWTRATTMLNGIAQRLAEEREEVIGSRASAVFQHLHAQLTELLAQSRYVVDAPPSADAAISAGAVDLYQEARAAEATYATIRAAQSHLARATWSIEFSGSGTWWHVLAYIAEPAQTFPNVLDWHARGYTPDEHGNIRKLNAPWPDLASPEGLAWLLAHPDAHPWVPTRDEYDTLADHLEMATSAAHSARASRA